MSDFTEVLKILGLMLIILCSGPISILFLKLFDAFMRKIDKW